MFEGLKCWLGIHDWGGVRMAGTKRIRKCRRCGQQQIKERGKRAWRKGEK